MGQPRRDVSRDVIRDEQEFERVVVDLDAERLLPELGIDLVVVTLNLFVVIKTCSISPTASRYLTISISWLGAKMERESGGRAPAPRNYSIIGGGSATRR